MGQQQHRVSDMAARTAALPAALITHKDRIPLPGSPATPSPEGARQMKKLLQRLEEINNESRELLNQLFGMLEKDMRLEKYIRRRLDDPRVSYMWEMVEQILVAKHGPINLDDGQLMNHLNNFVDKGVISDDELETSGARLQRFKIRTLDTTDEIMKTEPYK
ncbi:hypothetical protein Nepgr_011792 [Nepenthes gracilis]|uniref:Uncharacterized protein n=1 Tax=Nepenthes gracilis TaxID=150966 RepID=A0AAD3SFR4_NEPGR|nr:hypothetical protein Nepgr_011792 [Nepenthes gracilis]